MRTVIISPYSQKLRNGNINPKNYPYWADVVRLLRQNGIKTIQVGVSGEDSLQMDETFLDLPLKKLQELTMHADTWASVDNFYNHFCSYLKKPGVVVFGKSDPNIYGYEQNINLLKDRALLRQKQYDIWEAEAFDPNAFVNPDVVCLALCNIMQV